MGRKLDTIDLYMQTFGTTKVPNQYKFWTGVALVAACMGKQCGIVREVRSIDDEEEEPLADVIRPLAPNFYIMLIGPSGCGKNYAIEHAEFMLPPDLIDKVNPRDGRITGPALLKSIGMPIDSEDPPPNAYMWLLMPELASALTSVCATDFIAIVTELYRAGKPFRDGTVLRGDYIVPDPCINWLGGSTEPWCRRAITGDAIEGGFWARVIVSYLPEDWRGEKVPTPVLPKKFNSLVREVRERLRDVARLNGEFEVTPDARARFNAWSDSRPDPDVLGKPWYNREPDHVWKLAMVLAVADRPKLIIEDQHMVEAIKFIARAGTANRIALEQITACSGATIRSRVLRAIMSYGDDGITRSALYRKLISYVMSSRDLDDIIKSVVESGEVEERHVKSSGRPKTLYVATTFAREREARAREGAAEMDRALDREILDRDYAQDDERDEHYQDPDGDDSNGASF